jgi:DNA-binding NtrC family response regulator
MHNFNERPAATEITSPVIGVVGSRDNHSYALLLQQLQAAGCAVEHFAEPPAPTVVRQARLDILFLFVRDLDICALELHLLPLVSCQRLHVVPIVEYADQAVAARLLELGCIDYLLAPFSATQVTALLQRHAQASTAREGFISQSAASRRLLAMAQRVALTRMPVLISGETGTGKELMARYIHGFGASAGAPFVAVNCAAIPEAMLESLLFGHERGAFTGAVNSQAGKFELANGGTLLLDEIGELPLGLQAKLLRVLQERRVERLGGRREIELDVRIIAASNRDLREEVAQGRFREDLLYRLDVLPLHIPPLRERREDILPLARSFIQRCAPHEDPDQLLTESACQALLQHAWPGNVRELENTLQRALVLRNGLFIQPVDLGLAAPEPATVSLTDAPQEGTGGRAALKASGKLAEYQHVLDTIRRFDGHKAKAAQSLGMTPRALRYRLNAMREQGMQINF